jgi:hypothetical protein
MLYISPKNYFTPLPGVKTLDAGQPNDKWKGKRGKTQKVFAKETRDTWIDDRTPVGSEQYLGISPQEMGFESGPLSIITSLHRSSSSTLASVSISKFVMKVPACFFA